MPATNKRKADSAPDSSGRKRAQNRTSQQCLREKNLAYVRNLEETVQLLRSAAAASNDNGCGGGQDRYTMLLEAHLKQMKENQRLREALLRLRKKLLSMSNAAAAAADDEIFGSILGREVECDGEDSSPSKPTQSLQSQSRPLSRGQSRNLDNVDNERDSTETVGITSTLPQSKPQDRYTFGTTSVPGAPFEDPTLAFLDFHSVGSEMDDSLQAMLFSGQDNSTADAMSGLHLTMSFPAQTVVDRERIVITSGTVFGAKLLSACQKYLKRASCALEPSQELSYDVGKRLLLAAANLISCSLGLESYLYGVNGVQYMEKVLGWRLGLHAKDGVPSPFRPTPLQSKDPVHFWGIDLFQWPTIRDQLLLEQQPIDYDMLTKDILLHSVIDEPHRGVAFSVLDVFQNYLLRRKTRSSQDTAGRNYLNDPSWILFETDPDIHSFYPYEADPVEQALIVELERRMQTPLPESKNSPSFSSLTEEGYRLNDISSFFGLDNMAEWKLSKEFARKYPFLDCSAAVSSCEMTPCTTLLCW